MKRTSVATSIAVIAALLSGLPCVHAAYNLVRTWEGQSFFNGWDFYGYYDNLTNGDAIWVNQSLATSDRLAYVDGNGKAILRVDNFTNVPWNEKRNTVRITTQDSFPVGSVILLDVLHLPYGCSVWPAFWTMGDDWPLGGEIDIVEIVNLMNHNQMALHASTGCSKDPNSQQTGSNVNSNCTDGPGCTVAETNTNSAGAAFANAQGGVWAMQFDVSGIYIWFWNRANLPSNLQSPGSVIDTSGWGTPSAAYPSTTCNISQFFTAQKLVLDITLCGDWAGVPSVYNATCSGGSTGLCYNDNVIGAGSPRYDNAYFVINYARVYTVDGLPASVSSSLHHSSTSTSNSPSPTATGSTSSSNSGPVLHFPFSLYLVLLCAGALAVFV